MMGSMLCGVGTKQVWRGLAGKTVIREVGLVMVAGRGARWGVRQAEKVGWHGGVQGGGGGWTVM